MRVFYQTDEAAGKINRPVVTTGSFDGVHIGHKVIINRLNQLARDIQGESVLITFHPHPRKVLYPEQTDLKLINTQIEKIDLLRKAGLDNLIVIPFSIEFSKTTSHDFITRILIEQLGAKIVVVGHNHHFGHNREGDYSYLHSLSREFDFNVEEIPLQDIENETVSSTKIRKALFEGNIQRANAYLDHQYIMHGDLIDRQIEIKGTHYPALGIIIPEQEKLIPPPGIYATNLINDGDCQKAMTLISAEGEPQLILTMLLDDGTRQASDKGTLYFYKKVSDIDFYLEHEKINNCYAPVREMVEDLIY